MRKKLYAIRGLLEYDTSNMLAYPEIERRCTCRLTLFDIPKGSIIIEKIENEMHYYRDWWSAGWRRQDHEKTIRVIQGEFYYSRQIEMAEWGSIRIEIMRPGADEPGYLWYFIKGEPARPVRFEIKGFQLDHEAEMRADPPGRATKSITWETLL